MSQVDEDGDGDGTRPVNTQSAALRALPQRLTQPPPPSLQQLLPSSSPTATTTSNNNTASGRPPIVPASHRRIHASPYKTQAVVQEDNDRQRASPASLTSSSTSTTTSSNNDDDETHPHTVSSTEDVQSDGDEEDVIAERVLQSLQEKDRLIAELTNKLNMQTREATHAQSSLSNLQGVYERTACELRDAQDKVAFMQGLLDAERSRDVVHNTSTTTIQTDTHAPAAAGRDTTYAQATTSNTSDELRRVRAELAESQATVKLLEEELRHAQAAWERATTHTRTSSREDKHAPAPALPATTASPAALHSNLLEMSSDTASQSSQRTDLERTLAALAEAQAHDTDALRHHIELLQGLVHEKTAAMRAREQSHARELHALQDEIEALGTQLDVHLGSAQERRALQASLHAAQQREHELQSSHAAAQDEWLRELESQKALVEELQGKRRREGEQLHVIEAALQKKDAERARLRGELGRVREENAELLQKESNMAMEAQRLRSAMQAKEEELLRVQKEHKEHKAAHAQLASELEKVKEERSAAQEEAARLRQEALVQQVSHKSRIAVLQEKLRAEMQGCVSSSEELELCMQRVEAQRVQAEQRVLQLEEECESVRAAMRAAAVQAQRELLEHHELAESLSHKLSQDYAEAQEELAQRAERLTQLQAELHQTQEAHTALNKAHTQLQEEHTELTRALHESQEELQELKSGPVVALTRSLRDAMAEQLRLTQALHEADAKAAQKERTVSLLKRTGVQQAQEDEKLRRVVQEVVQAVEGQLGRVLKQSLHGSSTSEKTRLMKAAAAAAALHAHNESSLTTDTWPSMPSLQSGNVSSEDSEAAAAECNGEDMGNTVQTDKEPTRPVLLSTTSLSRALHTLQGRVAQLIEVYVQQRHTLQGSARRTQRLVAAARQSAEAALRERHAEEIRYHTTRYRELKEQQQQQQQQQDKAREEERDAEAREAAVQRAVQAALATQQQQERLVQSREKEAEEREQQQQQQQQQQRMYYTQGCALGAEVVGLFWRVVGTLCTWHYTIQGSKAKKEDMVGSVVKNAQDTTTAAASPQYRAIADTGGGSSDDDALRADCDAIAKELLGCEGGWAELSSLLTSSSSSQGQTNNTTTGLSSPAAAAAVTVGELMQYSAPHAAHEARTSDNTVCSAASLEQRMSALRQACTSAEVRARTTHEVVQYILHYFIADHTGGHVVLSLRQAIQACLPPVAATLLAEEEH